MEIIPVRSPLLKSGDDLAAIIAKEALQPGDILVISSKALATIEGVEIQLPDGTPTKQVKTWAAQTGLPASFIEAVITETERLNGTIVGACPGALLTELRPTGFPHGTLLVPNAGLDRSNVKDGYAIGWPHDPVKSLRTLRSGIQVQMSEKRKVKREINTDSLFSFHFSLVLSDSCCVPRRLGVTAFALACSGIDPFKSLIGGTDAFGNTMRITQEAVADQLATAANMVMGNADQRTPMAIVRNHGYTLSEYEGWVPGIEPGEDLFRDIFRQQ